MSFKEDPASASTGLHGAVPGATERENTKKKESTCGRLFRGLRCRGRKDASDKRRLAITPSNKSDLAIALRSQEEFFEPLVTRRDFKFSLQIQSKKKNPKSGFLLDNLQKKMENEATGRETRAALAGVGPWTTLPILPTEGGAAIQDSGGRASVKSSKSNSDFEKPPEFVLGEFGFVTVGATVTRLADGGRASELGVQKGWVLIAINDEFLTRGSRNGTPTIPAITAPVLKTLLQDALKLEQIKAWHAGKKFAEVSLIFWTNPIESLFEKPKAEEEEKVDLGVPSDVHTFREALLSSYGTYAKAWEEMDTDGSGTLDFVEFSEACVSLGFEGRKYLKKIFNSMDDNLSGEISLRELDPDFEAAPRCRICGLANPCEFHTEKEQKALRNRQYLERRKERNEGDVIFSWKEILSEQAQASGAGRKTG
jgi:hypothetical protein